MIVMVIMVMIVPMTVIVVAFLKMAVQILHVVVVAVVVFIEDHIKVTAVNARFFYPADRGLKPMTGNPFQDTQKFLLIRSQVEKRRNRHVAADSRPAFQIKDFLSILHPHLHMQGG